MSSVVVTVPARRRPPVLYIIAAFVVFAAVLSALTGAATKAQAKVDGRVVNIEHGTTVEALERAGATRYHDGNLVSVRGSVLTTGAGEPVTFVRNGKLVGPEHPVYHGDVITTIAGEDTTETVVATKVPIEPPHIKRGHGPIVASVRKGKPGIELRYVGAVSGEVLSRHRIKKPKPIIVRYKELPKNRKLVALTFDDGPWDGQTARVLDILKREDAKATFFVVGTQVKRFPALTRRIHKEGHLLGSHTYSHEILTTVDGATVSREMRKGVARIDRATGYESIWFRPPGGAVDDHVWDVAHRAGLRLVMWDVDPSDWSRPGAKVIIDRVVSEVEPGSIVLLHDGGGDRDDTLTALPYIIRKLKRAGYEFVTLEELAKAK